ncbi:ABC transporter ATP-binding protein [Ciceribacter sp. RN22]|uniref:ABC transporter ATP-binding protein n=1 Tax=Ciceribacter sp. RN22 TaxID=2954932 RepID=UPI002093728E|nr:ATP-binding cassette domain-containing protein [Ciceribacter sp. RN22]MCO6177087.1 ATP-binding cassette domain-containing protein [Ciceribacter sp. RN22]
MIRHAASLHHGPSGRDVAAGRGTDIAPAPPVPSGPVSISLTHVDKRFGDNHVLRGVDLEVPAGQFLAIVGKSGCGKSTLLRLLVGLDRPTSGAIAIRDGNGAAAANTRIVFQEPRLLPWASVIDNVAVGLRDGVPSSEARREAANALRDVQLADKAEQWPALLSGGQRQRVALARALVSRPGLLALDEPLGALDALTRITMQQLVSRVRRELGFTAVLVTHDVSEAVHLADRVIVLDQGRVSLDLAIETEHPRHHGDPELAGYERQLLEAIFGEA